MLRILQRTARWIGYIQIDTLSLIIDFHPLPACKRSTPSFDGTHNDLSRLVNLYLLLPQDATNLDPDGIGHHPCPGATIEE